jgi:hypothetical protein
MRSSTRNHLAKRLRELQAEFRHAFATTPVGDALSAEDVMLMERVADAVVQRGMAAPATVFLESMGPMSFLGSQALHCLTPIIEFAFNAKEVEQVARLLERRDTLCRLVALIDTKSAAKRAPTQ